MHRHRALADARSLARLVVTGDIEHDLVAVHIGVVVRDRDRERVVVDLARHEVADDEVVALEHLVDRGRLVHPTGDRLEVRDVEDIRIEASVPAHDIQRVVRVGVDGPGDPARSVTPVLDVDVRDQIGWSARALGQQGSLGQSDIPFAVWSMLEQLTVLAQVALWWGNVRARLDAVGAQRLLSGGYPTVGRRSRNDQIVATGNVKTTEYSLDSSGAALDEHALVTNSIAIERAWRVSHDVGDPNVPVAQNELSAGHRVNPSPGFIDEEVVQLEVTRQQGVVGRRRQRVPEVPRSGLADGRGKVPVIEQRRVRGEALLPHQLLVEETAISGAVLRVPLVGHVADPLVVRHGRPRIDGVRWTDDHLSSAQTRSTAIPSRADRRHPTPR